MRQAVGTKLVDGSSRALAALRPRSALRWVADNIFIIRGDALRRYYLGMTRPSAIASPRTQ